MKVASACILLSSLRLTEGFSPVSFTSTTSVRGISSTLNADKQNNDVASFDPLNLSADIENENNIFQTSSAMVPLVTILALTPEAAHANASPDWGLFEGKTGSLLHPAMMFGMFALSLSTALKGFQYKRQRTMGDEITALKKTLPDFGGASSLSEAIAAAKEAEDNALVSTLQAAMPIQSEIDTLVQERKELSSMGLRDGHYSQGALLAFLGTAFAIEVCL